MKVAVLGTGIVGRTLAARLAELGDEVTVGTRDVEATMARTEPDAMGNPPFAEWAHAHPQVTPATFAHAAVDAELVVNATSGNASIAALEAAGRENLAGKVLLDIANPLDYSKGFPPSLSVSNTDSLAEQIQAAFPEAKVVKSLNTMNASLMADPRRLADGDHTVFVSGNDADAKQVVTELLQTFGHTDVIDLGDLSTARGAETVLPIWIRLWGALGVPMFQFKIVR
ncbi:NADPH-dependent F420 reductase [Agromyces bauzanensis]|uniref:Oxidoreductase n=1 Tax=Agromyces bauzanensis TaxID=1308924 RepID=A0A917UXD9_9MICO|nr:NAD(P)-binding domain-containing protein [Agromyces bauzanensis]GGJ92955.1 oxidoreductase [Agromyces bauzanensis]